MNTNSARQVPPGLRIALISQVDVEWEYRERALLLARQRTPCGRIKPRQVSFQASFVRFKEGIGTLLRISWYC